MIVVDTNILAYLWIPGELSDLVERVLSKDSEWLVPFLWRSEFNSVLAGCIRRKMMTVEQAVKLCEEAQSQLLDKEYMVPSSVVLPLAESSNCSAYDCEFVALARELALPLVTSDKAILRAFPKVAQSPRAFVGAA